MIADRATTETYIRKVLPVQPEDPYYLDMDLVRASASKGVKETPTPPECQSGNSIEVSEKPSTKSRHEWTYGESEELLVTIKENKAKFEKATNKNSVWGDIANGMGVMTGTQCREKYYTLKKAYRKHVAESNKTGNKKPRPFLHETLLADILTDDPTFTPVVAKGTLEPVQPEDEDSGESSDAPGPSKPKKKKKSQVEELKEYMKERDDKFLEALKEMNTKQNALMEKLIEKL